jgi:hypothetical protein
MPSFLCSIRVVCFYVWPYICQCDVILAVFVCFIDMHSPAVVVELVSLVIVGFFTTWRKVIFVMSYYFVGHSECIILKYASTASMFLQYHTH